MQDENEMMQEESANPQEDMVGGIIDGDAEQQGVPNDAVPLIEENDPKSVKKRLGMQAKKHAREMRHMQEQLMQMREMLGSNTQGMHDINNFPSPGQPNPASMTEEERIQHAVRMALGMRENEQRQAEEAQKMAHVQKQYQRLNDEFDNASEKYDDFDDVVRANDVPFTPHVRDAMLLIKNPADVAYQLGKNRNELERISKLHPLDQAREIINLGQSLLNGQAEKPSSPKANTLGSIRVNPASSSNGNASAADIRRRMKAGTWK
jgi:hypothetical protein